jgi:hypothetical protein
VKRIVLSVAIEAADNATEAEVRLAVVRCIDRALHVYADCAQPRPHPLTGGPRYTFGYAVATVEVQS